MGLVLTLIAVVGAALALTPSVAEPLVRRALIRGASRLSGTLDPGRLQMDSWTRLTLDRVSWRDGTDLNVAARDVRLDIDPWRAVFGGNPVKAVSVGSVAFQVGDPDHPFESVDALTTRLKGAVRRAGGTAPDGPTPPVPSGKTRRTRGDPSRRTLPLITLDALSGAIHCHPFGEALIEGGWLNVVLPDDGLAGHARRIDGALDLTVAGDMPRHIAIAGQTSGGVLLESIRATSTPPLRFSLLGGDAQIAGVSWASDTIAAIEPSWARPDGSAVHAQSLSVRWSDRDDDTAQPDWLPAGVPDGVRRLIARKVLQEVEVLRPEIVWLRGAKVAQEKALPQQNAPTTPLDSPADFRGRLVAPYASVESRIRQAFAALTQGMARIPPLRLSVHGASFRLVGQAHGETDPDESLANVSLTLAKTSQGQLKAQVRFDAPESTPGSNELVAAFDPLDRRLTGTLRVATLPLVPYAQAFPAALRPGSDGLLEAADITFQADLPDRLVLTGAATLRGLSMDMPAVASSRVHDIDVRLSGALVWDLQTAAIEMSDALVSVGRIQVPFTASGSNLRDWPKIRLDAAMTRMNAQDALESIPSDMLPALDGVRLAGTVAATATLDIDTRNLSAMRFNVLPDVADMRTVSLGKAAGVELLRTHFLHRIERGDKSVVNRIVGKASPEWVPIESVPRQLIGALTTSEDAEFFRHQGFSPEGIRRSLRVNLERGGFYQGASTLSQQLVKNLFLSREKTLARKLQEAFLTWQVEQYLTKEKILELYLNVIEWGPGVWGIGPAARHYFGKSPAALSLLEAAYLVSIIPAPSRNHAHWEAGAVPKPFEQRVKRLVREMQRRGLVDAADADVAAEQTLRLASPHGPGTQDPRPGDLTDIPDDEFSD